MEDTVLVTYYVIATHQRWPLTNHASQYSRSYTALFTLKLGWSCNLLSQLNGVEVTMRLHFWKPEQSCNRSYCSEGETSWRYYMGRIYEEKALRVCMEIEIETKKDREGEGERDRERGRNPAAPVSHLSLAIPAKVPGTWMKPFWTFHLWHWICSHYLTEVAWGTTSKTSRRTTQLSSSQPTESWEITEWVLF